MLTYNESQIEGVKQAAITNVSVAEGGYSFHPDDRGGETFRGISRKHHPGWRGWETVDHLKESGVRKPDININVALATAAREFYHDMYVATVPRELSMNPMAIQFFSQAVVAGKKTAVLALQRAISSIATSGQMRLSIAEDGIWGKETAGGYVRIVHENNNALFIVNYNRFCNVHFARVVEAHPKQITFLVGWMNRAYHALYAALDYRHYEP